MELNPMHKSDVFVLALVVCSHLVFYVNGRQMKLVVISNKEDRRQLNAEQVLPPSGFEDGFRPYSPENNVRVGHSFEEDDGDDNEGTPGSSSSVDGRHSLQDFKRTSPGHSPGVGHAFVNKNVSEKNV
ncbi:hypothetical protein HRI_003470700 [Hibiscus trionum]|uniref:Uncharacterized protein n=1 Tax=Hibiscus trionum TaxID=183268 RepID=A0A9W7MFA8_HIBTR|nr:hypothetical protein HRI_003470700 [Hibiscus trionum]